MTWAGVRDFTIVFGLIWIAWINGSFYHELHGRNDGRTRNYTFAQMALLAQLAVYAGHAAAEPADGRAFAIVYAILLTLIALQWFSLRKYDTPDMAALTTRLLREWSSRSPSWWSACSSMPQTPGSYCGLRPSA